MDQNKLKVLKDIEYKIQECCGLCAYGTFKPGTSFGTCSVQTYDHLKHTGPERNLSINRYGKCFTFKLVNEDVLAKELGNWTQYDFIGD